MVESGWEETGRGQSLRTVLALMKGVDFIPNIIGYLLEDTVHWLVLSIIPAKLFAPRRAVTPQPVHRSVHRRDERKEGGQEGRKG